MVLCCEVEVGGKDYANIVTAAMTIMRQDGLEGFYRGNYFTKNRYFNGFLVYFCWCAPMAHSCVFVNGVVVNVSFGLASTPTPSRYDLVKMQLKRPNSKSPKLYTICSTEKNQEEHKKGILNLPYKAGVIRVFEKSAF